MTTPTHKGSFWTIMHPDGQAPPAALDSDGMPTGPGPFLIEVHPSMRKSRGRWWKPDAAGYTNSLDRAGLYALDSFNVRDICAEPDLTNGYLVDCAVLAAPTLRLLHTLMHKAGAEAVERAGDAGAFATTDHPAVTAFVQLMAAAKAGGAKGTTYSDALGILGGPGC